MRQSEFIKFCYFMLFVLTFYCLREKIVIFIHSLLYLRKGIQLVGKNVFYEYTLKLLGRLDKNDF